MQSCQLPGRHGCHAALPRLIPVPNVACVQHADDFKKMCHVIGAERIRHIDTPLFVLHLCVQHANHFTLPLTRIQCNYVIYTFLQS